MSEFIQVRNWREFQHYGKRNPPWIKAHNTLLEDIEWERLPDAAKAHLLGIWLLASRTDNKIPRDARWVAKKIGANEPVDLDLLMSTRWLEPWGAGDARNDAPHDARDDASTALASGETEQSRDRAETESLSTASADHGATSPDHTPRASGGGKKPLPVSSRLPPEVVDAWQQFAPGQLTAGIEGELKRWVEERGPENVVTHIAEFYSSGGRKWSSFRQRLREDWQSQPVEAPKPANVRPARKEPPPPPPEPKRSARWERVLDQARERLGSELWAALGSLDVERDAGAELVVSTASPILADRVSASHAEIQALACEALGEKVSILLTRRHAA